MFFFKCLRILNFVEIICILNDSMMCLFWLIYSQGRLHSYAFWKTNLPRLSVQVIHAIHSGSLLLVSWMIRFVSMLMRILPFYAWRVMVIDVLMSDYFFLTTLQLLQYWLHEILMTSKVFFSALSSALSDTSITVLCFKKLASNPWSSLWHFQGLRL